jgi:zinc transporter 1/2/3
MIMRVLLLLFLLSTREALSIYQSVSVAAGAHSHSHSHSHGRDDGKDMEPRGRGGPLQWFGMGSNSAAEVSCEASASPLFSFGRAAKGKGGVCRAKASQYRGGAGGQAEFEIPLNAFKIIMSACLTSLNVACWLLPMKIRRFTESKTAIGMANAFSGGVFLSLAFGHMIPHAHHGMVELGFHDATPFYLTLGGYLLIFFVEKIMFDAHAIMHEAEDAHSHSHSHSHGKDLAGNGGGATAAAKGGSGRSAMILLLALSIHSMFETMALGLSDTRLNAGLLSMSIALHQPAESLALLVAFLNSGLSRAQTTRALAVFSCVGPLGMGLGVLISEHAGPLWDAVLVALAAGTFIYVGATEMIAEEFESPHNKWPKFGALVVGVGLIAVISSWAESLEHMTG